MSLRTRVKRAYKIAAGAAKRVVTRQISRMLPAGSGPLVCAAMVRNEADLIEVWVAHLGALFDRIIVIDHQSTDGTRALLHRLAEQLPALEVRHHDEDAFIQAPLMTGVLEEMAARHPSGWLFFLDADEFLMVPSRAALQSILDRHNCAITIRSTWVNAYPEVPCEHATPRTRIRGWYEAPGINSKVAVNLAYARLVARIEVGNHSVRFRGLRVLRNVDILHILHLPIRSGAQIMSKITLGYSASAQAYPGEGHACHWRMMQAHDMTDDLRRYVYNYGCYDHSDLSLTLPPPETIDATLSALVPLLPLLPLEHAPDNVA